LRHLAGQPQLDGADLHNLRPDASADSPLYREAREIGQRFQNGLNGIFFENETRIVTPTRVYGVF
jgi:hypothetical protein